MDDVSLLLFLLIATFFIHGAYGFGVLARAKKMRRGQMEQYERRLHVMAHSLYTPLGSIRNFTELLSREKVRKNAVRMAEYTDIIDDNVVRMLEILRYYVDISRLENNTFPIFIRDYSLATIAEERRHFYSSRVAKASVILKMEVAHDVPIKTTFDSRAVSHMIDRMLSCFIERSDAHDTLKLQIFAIKSGQTFSEALQRTGNVCVLPLDKAFFSSDMVGLAVSSSKNIFEQNELQILFSYTGEDEKESTTSELTVERFMTAQRIGLTVMKRWAEAHGGTAGAHTCASGSLAYFVLPQTMETLDMLSPMV